MLYLFIDEDGFIWHERDGASKRVANLTDHDGLSDALLEAIAETTDQKSVEYRLITESGNVIDEGVFTQGESGSA